MATWEWTREGTYAEMVRRLRVVDRPWWDKLWDARSALWPQLGPELRRTECIAEAMGGDLKALYEHCWHQAMGYTLENSMKAVGLKYESLTAEMVDENRGPLLSGKGGVQKLSKFLAQLVNWTCYGPTGIDRNHGATVAGQITDAVRAHNGAFLTLSANPLDILDSSHYCTWTSCHGWWEGERLHQRERAAGNFSYVAVPHLLVATCHSKDYPASKKSWRQLIWASGDKSMAAMIREYGIKLSEVRHTLVRQMVAELLAGQSNPPWRYHNKKNSDQRPEGWRFVSQNEDGIPYTQDYALATGIIRIGEHRELRPDLETVAPKVECPGCGRERSGPSAQHVQCGRCGGRDLNSLFVNCSDCDDVEEREFRNASYAERGGWRRTPDWVCPDCIDDHWQQCGGCGNWVSAHSDNRLRDVPYVDSLGNRSTLNYCRHCAMQTGAVECKEDGCGEWVHKFDKLPGPDGKWRCLDHAPAEAREKLLASREADRLAKEQELARAAEVRRRMVEQNAAAIREREEALRQQGVFPTAAPAGWYDGPTTTSTNYWTYADTATAAVTTNPNDEG